jgi:hypothetical protein
MAFRLGLRATRTMRFQQPVPSRFQQMAQRRAATTDANAAEAADKQASKDALKAGVKRDPELIVCLP